MIDVKMVERALDREFHSLIPQLLSGISKEDLEAKIAEIKGFTATDPRLEITRMNLIGGLRSWGFEISGGRKGRSLPYQILDWHEKETKPTVDTWTGESKEVVDWVHSLLPLRDYFEIVKLYQSFRGDYEEEFHENCFLYPYAYEAAQDQAWIYFEGSEAALIFQRFKNLPRFRIFDLCASPETLLSLAFTISHGSTRPVPIINCQTKNHGAFKSLHPAGSWGQRHQAIYDVVDIAEHPDKYLNKRALETLRSRERDTAFYENPSQEEQLYVIDTWKRLNEGRHRQLAIERDRVAVRADYPDKIVFGGSREGHPVLHHLFDPLSNKPDTVALINEKSLNYGKFPDGEPVPGGKYGLSDLNQILACRALAQKGFRYIQSGGLDGGGFGLEDKKMKYACRTVASQTFYTDYPLSDFA